VFLGIAIGSLFWPAFMAEGLSYHVESIDARNEFRAVYVGLWLAHVGILGLGAVRIDRSYLGDIAAVLILGQVSGRVVSILLDGFPSSRMLAMLLLESLGGLAILIVRPSEASPPEEVAPPAPG
jgi:hypothetical protein